MNRFDPFHKQEDGDRWKQDSKQRIRHPVKEDRVPGVFPPAIGNQLFLKEVVNQEHQCERKENGHHKAQVESHVEDAFVYFFGMVEPE